MGERPVPSPGPEAAPRVDEFKEVSHEDQARLDSDAELIALVAERTTARLALADAERADDRSYVPGAGENSEGDQPVHRSLDDIDFDIASRTAKILSLSDAANAPDVIESELDYR